MDLRSITIPCRTPLSPFSGLSPEVYSHAGISVSKTLDLTFFILLYTEIFTNGSIVTISDSLFPLFSWAIQIGISALKKLWSSRNHPSYLIQNPTYSPHLTWPNYSFDKYLLSSYCVTGIVLDDWSIAVSKTDQKREKKKKKNPLLSFLMEFTFWYVCGVAVGVGGMGHTVS